MVTLVAWSTSVNEESVAQFKQNVMGKMDATNGPLVVLFSNGQWCQIKGGDVNDTGVLRFLCDRIQRQGVQIHGFIYLSTTPSSSSTTTDSSESTTASQPKSFCINTTTGESYRLDYCY